MDSLSASFQIERFQCDDIKKLKLGVTWNEVELDKVFAHLKSVRFPIFFELKDQYENSLLVGMHEKYSFLLFDVYHLENPMVSLELIMRNLFLEDENIGIVACFIRRMIYFGKRMLIQVNMSYTENL